MVLARNAQTNIQSDRRTMQTVAGSLLKQDWLTEAFSIVEHTEDMDGVVSKLRDFLTVDHVVYYSTKLEAPTVPYIRLTYPASWVKRYLQMGYGEVDLILREGFKRTLPFEWKELKFTSPVEAAFQSDALAHGIGPARIRDPGVEQARLPRLFVVCSSQSEETWAKFLSGTQAELIQIAHRLHSRVVVEVFGKDRPQLTAPRGRMLALGGAWQGRHGDCRHSQHLSAYDAGLFEICSL
jgi:hypothetical protein